jgi:hypothetical protein
LTTAPPIGNQSCPSTTWQESPEQTIDLPDNVKAGVSALNSTTRENTVQFEKLKLTRQFMPPVTATRLTARKVTIHVIVGVMTAACHGPFLLTADEWRPEPTPAVEPGPLNDWDDFQVGAPCVVRGPNGWRMYYVGARLDERGFSSALGVAVTGPHQGTSITLRSFKSWRTGEESWIVRGWEEVQPPELVLEPIGYDDWWPAGGDDERTPGNAIAVTATLQRRGGGPFRYPARRIRFELARVSREPGVSLNWPPQSQLLATSPPDFQIDPDRNRPLIVTDDVNRQKAQPPDGEHVEAAVVISSYDWGAFGRLRAVAELTNGGTADAPDLRQSCSFANESCCTECWIGRRRIQPTSLRRRIDP